MKTIIETITEARGGHYCHALEVATIFELECVIEVMVGEFLESHGKRAIIEFFESMSIYYQVGDGEEENEEDEKAINDFDFAQSINDNV